MNNDTVTYYVTVDANNYIQSASTQADTSKIKIQLPMASLNDFTVHMNLYQAYSNGGIDYPDLKASTLANQIDDLKNVNAQQANTVAALINQNQSLQKLLISLQANVTAQIAKLQTK